MKVKLVKLNPNEKFVNKDKELKIGDTVEVAKERAEDLIKRGNFESVPTQTQSKAKANTTDK